MSFVGTRPEAVKYVEKYIAEEKDERTFHIILTTSNHPPYNIDVVAKGFPKEEIKQKIAG